MVAPPRSRYGLPAALRLRRSAEFAATRRRGERLVCGCLILNWLSVAPGRPNRVGVVTSRKVGSAVVRNRARRLLREAFRRHQHALKGPLDVVLVARRSIAGKRAGEVEQDFLAALRRRALLRSAA